MFAKIILSDKKTCNFIKKYDVIIPVPISKKRKKKRGYNQSELVANELAQKLNQDIWTDIIIKKKDNVATIVMIAAFIAACVLGINVIYIVIASGVFGVIRTIWNRRRKRV